MSTTLLSIFRAASAATLLAACLLFGPTARGAEPASGATVAAPASPSASPQPGLVDLKQSRIYIKVAKKRIGHDHAIEGTITSGLVRLGASTAAGELIFELAKFSADGPTAREFVGLKGEIDKKTQKQVTAAMLGPEVLHVEKFRRANFAIDSATLTPAADGEAPKVRLEGSFTLHGVTRPISVLAIQESIGDRLRLSGKFDLLQTDYGIKPYSRALGAIGVTDKLEIYGEIMLHAAKESP